MSKVHEALRRAERERAAAGWRPAEATADTPPAQGGPASEVGSRGVERGGGVLPHEDRGAGDGSPGHAAQAATEPAVAAPEPAGPPEAAAGSGPGPVAESPAAAHAEHGAGAEAEAPTAVRPSASPGAARGTSAGRQLRLDGARVPTDVRLAEGLVAFARPRSLAAEQYRAIRTQLATFARSVPVRTMVVTSPLPGEGKTTTAANLAIVLSQEVGRRICLVDCDLRSPQIHTLFGLAPREGLADVLRRRTSLEAALVSTPINALWLLTAGHLPPNPAELLGSPTMREVVSSLRESFDTVVIDSPPVLPLPDPAILSGLADGVVLVVLAGRTPRRLIDRALDRLQGAMLLGFVLNNTDEFRHYAYYYYNYGA